MTFAINPDDATNRRQVAAPVAVQGGVETGARGVALEAPRQGAKLGTDLLSLMKYSGGMLTEKLKQSEEEAFLDGMSQAAQGVAAADINAERPAWAQAFGDSTAVAGARAYEKVADSADLQTQVVEAMPELRRLPPDEFKTEVFRMLKSRETGDSVRDNVLLQTTLGWLPNIMVSHAKAHLGWQQAEAEAADLQMKDKVFTAHEALVRAQTQDPTQADPTAMEASARDVLGMLTPLPGVNVEQHSKRVVSLVRDHLTRGNMAVWNVLKTSGWLEEMDPDQVRMLRNTAQEAASRYLPEKVPATVRAAYRTLRLNAANIGESELIEAVETLNKTVVEQTGIDERPFVSAAALDDLLGSRAAGIMRRQEQAAAKAERAAEREQDMRRSRAERAAERAADRRAAAAEKAAEEAQRAAMFRQDLSDLVGQWEASGAPAGGLGVAVDTAARTMSKPTAVRDAAIDNMFKAATNDPAKLGQMVDAVGPKYVPDATRVSLAGAFDAENPSPVALGALRTMSPLSRGALLSGPALQAFTEYDSLMRQYGVDSLPPDQQTKAMTDAFRTARLSMRLNPSNSRDLAAGMVESVTETIVKQSGIDPFDNVTIGKVSPALLAHAAAGIPAGPDREDMIAGRAMTMVHVSDGVLVHKDPANPGADAQFMALMTANGRTLGRHVEEFLGDDADKVEFIVQGPPDARGRATLQVFLEGMRSLVVTHDELRKVSAYKPEAAASPAVAP